MIICSLIRNYYVRTRNYILKKRKEISLAKYLRKSKPRVILFGVPTHNNIGDSAITIAEHAFLQKCGFKATDIYELTYLEAQTYLNVVSKYSASAKVFFCFHGGGNMGDQWFSEELLRRNAIQKLNNSHIVVLPQTIFYSDTDFGILEQHNSVPYYGKKDKITLVAREKPSYEIMNSLYPDTSVLLTPDIVLSTAKHNYEIVPAKRCGILLCARGDKEKKIDDNVWKSLEKLFEIKGKQLSYTDMYSDCSINADNRMRIVSGKMQEFMGAELVITDRLHGMIFAAITETPCIVFENYNHKVRGTYEWIKYLPYIRFVNTVDEAIAVIDEMPMPSDCHFTNEPLLPYFQFLLDKINLISDSVNCCSKKSES